jgi:hypothetical protein
MQNSFNLQRRKDIMDGLYSIIAVLGIIAILGIISSILAEFTDSLDLPEPLDKIAMIPGLIASLIGEMTRKW